MPKVTKHETRVKNGEQKQLTTFYTDIKVNTSGVFYAKLDEEMYNYLGKVEADSAVYLHMVRGSHRLESASMEGLTNVIDRIYKNKYQSTITSCQVIQYNIESHVAFAQDAEGNVFPNAGCPGAKWGDNLTNSRFGNHHSANVCNGGYSLTVGARACTKRTTTYIGGYQEHTYVAYYGDGGSHHGHAAPAEKLNSWCSFKLPEKCKEIPYTDESALFFHDLMMGVAILSKRVQDMAGDEDILLKFIDKGTRLLSHLT